MLLSHIMKHTKFGTLKVCIERLRRVVVGFSTDIFLFPMVHPIVSGKHLTGFAITLKLIGHEMRSFIDKMLNVRQKIGQFVASHRNIPHRTVASNRDKYSLFLGPPPSFMSYTIFVTRFSTDIFFIQFNDALQRWNHLRPRVYHFPDSKPIFQALF